MLDQETALELTVLSLINVSFTRKQIPDQLVQFIVQLTQGTKSWKYNFIIIFSIFYKLCPEYSQIT